MHGQEAASLCTNWCTGATHINAHVHIHVIGEGALCIICMQHKTCCEQLQMHMLTLQVWAAAIAGSNLTDDRQTPGAAGSKLGSGVGATAGMLPCFMCVIDVCDSPE